MNGQYYVEYHGVFGMMGTPSNVRGHMEQGSWMARKNVKEKVVERGKKLSWVASYDGFT